MKVLIIFRIYFFIFSFCLYSSVFSQNRDDTNSNLTQDWIFGDGPEPKWVIELLHGAYQNVKEDNSYILKVPVAESGIKYSASVDGNAVIKQDGDYLIISPFENFNGSILVKLSLDMSFILNVESVNDKPILSSIPDQEINEDEILEIKLMAKDAEGDDLTFGATTDNNATVNIIDDNLTVTPLSNFFGPIKVSLAVSDGKTTDESSFILNVKPINDAPVIESIFSKTEIKRNQVDLMIDGLDIDGDNLIYSVVGDGGADFDIKSNKVTVKPKDNYKGSTPITITTSDGKSSIDTSFTLINPIPGLSAFAPQSMLEDEVLSIILNMKDVESDSFRYNIKKINNAKIEINDNQLSIFPDKDYYGELILDLNISDKKDSTDFSFNINVISQPDVPVADAGKDIMISNGCNSKLFLDGSGSFDPDNDISSYKWTLLESNKVILNGLKGYYNFKKHDEDLNQKIILTVTDNNQLVDHDTLDVKIINDKPPIANAGENFIAQFNKYVNLDGSKSIDRDSDLKYFWRIISKNASFKKGEEVKQFPKFKYPPELSNPMDFVITLEVQDHESFCFSMDTVIVTCLPNVDMADSTIKYEIVKADKKDRKVYVDLNITNKQLWPFDFAAFTLVSVKDEKNKLGQIDPYKGKNTVKYGIENEEKVKVELVYEFDHSPKEINIICKSTMALNADSVLFVQTF